MNYNLLGVADPTDAYGYSTLDQLYDSDPSSFTVASMQKIWFNHSLRFPNGTQQMLDYACSDTYQQIMFTFVPFCEFPFVPMGWGPDENGFWNASKIVLNDCSQTWAEAEGLSAYNRTCTSYAIFAMLPFFVSLYFQTYVNRTKALGKQPTFIFPRNMNTTESMNFYSCVWAFAHLLLCVDIETTRGTYSRGLRQVFMGTVMAVSMHIVFLQVSTWIIIIRKTSGQNLHRNKYIIWFQQFSSASLLLEEYTCGQAQNWFGVSKSFGILRYGYVKNFQYLWFCVMCGSWAFMGYRYGKKISALLKMNNKSGGKINPSDVGRMKAIKR